MGCCLYSPYYRPTDLGKQTEAINGCIQIVIVDIKIGEKSKMSLDVRLLPHRSRMQLQLDALEYSPRSSVRPGEWHSISVV